jgi:hypothetical protein
LPVADRDDLERLQKEAADGGYAFEGLFRP